MCFVTPHLSVIVPAYNEEARILPTLEKMDAFLAKQAYGSEVIVVDDGSKDRTAEVVEKFAATHPRFTVLRNGKNRGKGASVKRGMLAANGKFRLFSDADLSTPIEEAAKFLDLCNNGFDVVIGSRRVRGSQIDKRQPLHREISGRVFSIIVRILALRGFLDTQCGFKMFKAEAAEKIFKLQTIMDFGFDVEVLFLAQKLGCKIKEAPVVWVDSPLTTVRLGGDSLRMFGDLFLIRKNQLLGRYRGQVASFIK